jgi:tRNA (guanine10-N2)-methyltransferase
VCIHFFFFENLTHIYIKPFNAKYRYSSSDLPEHSSMRLISNSEQNFGQWSRRLVTMEKYKDSIVGDRTNIHNVKGLNNLSSVYNKKKDDETETTDTKGKKKPGHYLFREKVNELKLNYN